MRAHDARVWQFGLLLLALVIIVALFVKDSVRAGGRFGLSEVYVEAK